MKLLVLDNYDSFTYNLVYLTKQLGCKPDVIRNDKISLEEVDAYDAILLSPGPGVPKDAGIMPSLLQKYSSTKKILGVCLGHQAIGEAFGAQLFNMPNVLHGVAVNTEVEEPNTGLFKGLPSSISTCRYHSWAIKAEDFPANELKITAKDDKGLIMAIQHLKYPVFGVQFHPESILTEYGKELISNWINY